MSDERTSYPTRAMGDSEDRQRVFLQLSKDQVDRIIQRADEAADDALPRREDPGDSDGGEAGESTQWLFAPLMNDKSFSHSLLIGLQVLTCFPLDGTERGVAEVAEQLKMNSSTVHRYMSTLLRVGLLERNPVTRWYRVAYTNGSDGIDHWEKR